MKVRLSKLCGAVGVMRSLTLSLVAVRVNINAPINKMVTPDWKSVRQRKRQNEKTFISQPNDAAALTASSIHACKYNLKTVFMRPISPTSTTTSTARVSVNAVPIINNTARLTSGMSGRRMRIPAQAARGKASQPIRTPSAAKKASRAINKASETSNTTT